MLLYQFLLLESAFYKSEPYSLCNVSVRQIIKFYWVIKIMNGLL